MPPTSVKSWTKQEVLMFVASISVSVAHVVVGAIGYDDCPEIDWLTAQILAAGLTGMIVLTVTFCSRTGTNAIGSYTVLLFCLPLVAVKTWGVVLIFPNTDCFHSCGRNNAGCSAFMYTWSFLWNVSTLVLFLFVLGFVVLKRYICHEREICDNHLSEEKKNGRPGSAMTSQRPRPAIQQSAVGSREEECVMTTAEANRILATMAICKQQVAASGENMDATFAHTLTDDIPAPDIAQRIVE